MADETTATRRGPAGVKRGLDRRLPFWGGQLVVLAAVAIDFALPDTLAPFGPVWLFPSIEMLLLIGLVAVTPHSRMRHSALRRRLAIALTAFVSAVNVVSLVRLVHLLLRGKASNGHALILAGSGLWITNVLLFGLWYWEIDRGGPLERATGRDPHPDFLFPQMTDSRWSPPDWSPGLVDYLYVSFTNATAFSPTDTMPLTRTAKALMAVQALVSLVTVGLVVARAVNILS